MNYIKVKNWDKFQCFHDGRPIKWIKFYVALLDDEDFEELPDDCKLTLLVLWLFSARKGNGKVRADSKWLLKKLPIKKVRLQPLIDAGFIETYENVQEGVRNRTQRRVEKSREEKKREEYTLEFLEFWNKYPKRWIESSGTWVKSGKHLAFEQWSKLSQSEQQYILRVVGKLRAGKMVPDAWRWLRDRKWEDYDLPKPQPAPLPKELTKGIGSVDKPVHTRNEAQKQRAKLLNQDD